MKNYKLEEELNNYILNPRDANINFNLGNIYFEINQYASAMSYYLRCAEISDDKELVYESLLSSWLCIKNVKDRPIFERGQLMTIIAQSPDRPEAYYFICNWLEIHGEKSYNSNEEKFHQMYLYACIGVSNILFDKDFLNFKEYPGYYGLMFYKAFSAWQIGKIKESEDIFVDLFNNHIVNDNFKSYIHNNIINLNLESRIVEKKKKCYLTTFGDDKFFANRKKVLKKQAEETKWFNDIFIETPSTINNLLVDHKDFIDANPSGYGYWIWKPMIIEKQLKNIKDNDIVFYLDCGSSIISKDSSRFKKYLNLLDKYDMILFQNGEKFEKNFLKMNVINEFELLDTDFLELPIIESGFIIAKKTPFTLKFIKEWKDKLTSNDYNLVNDDLLNLKQLDTFIEHRHDQSILAILARRYENKIKILEGMEELYNVGPFYHSRLTDEGPRKYAKPIPFNTIEKSVKLPIYCEPLIYNNKKKLKHNFKNYEIIEKNNSQVYQDMFVLSMLNGKKNGTYLEIGAGSYHYGNNTHLLEKSFDWNGISIDIDESLSIDFNNNRNNKCLNMDALQVDYEVLLEEKYKGKEIDYLQLDCDPSNVTYEILLKIPFDKFKFGVITYEHDHYTDITGKYRSKSREYLSDQGYILVAGNICPDDVNPFEDWWVHPDLISKDIFKKYEKNDLPISGEKYMIK